MKRATTKARKHKSDKAVQPQPAPRKEPTGAMFPRWALIVLCLLVTAGSTWAVFEFVVWNTLPAELVGKWEVTEGPQRGAIFNFSRNGTLEAHFQSADPDKMNVMQASVTVEDKKLLVTTRNPNTKQNETRACLIRELTAKTLVVEFEQGEKAEKAEKKKKGEVFKMVRVP